MLRFLIFGCIFGVVISAILGLFPRAGYAQFRDSTWHGDTIHITYSRQPSYGKLDSLPKASDFAVQFLAGEAAFNAAFYIIAGNSFNNPQYSQFNGQGTLALLACVITPPLAIALVSKILHLREGSILASLGGAFIGLVPIGFLLYPPGHSPAFGILNLRIGLPIVGLAELFYDLTIPSRS